nr:MAG TPA: hypothetical protein [Caudoviricetes sp.]
MLCSTFDTQTAKGLFFDRRASRQDGRFVKRSFG